MDIDGGGTCSNAGNGTISCNCGDVGVNRGIGNGCAGVDGYAVILSLANLNGNGIGIHGEFSGIDLFGHMHILDFPCRGICSVACVFESKLYLVAYVRVEKDFSGADEIPVAAAGIVGNGHLLPIGTGFIGKYPEGELACYSAGITMNMLECGISGRNACEVNPRRSEPGFRVVFDAAYISSSLHTEASSKLPNVGGSNLLSVGFKFTDTSSERLTVRKALNSFYNTGNAGCIVKVHVVVLDLVTSKGLV